MTARESVLQPKKTLQLPNSQKARVDRGFIRTAPDILNFVLGGFATTLAWLLATLVSVVLIFTLSLTCSCWEIAQLSLFPYGNETIHVGELSPAGKGVLLSTGGTVPNIFRLIFFGWWSCLVHVISGVTQCITIIGVPVNIANFKITAVTLWPVSRRVVSVEVVRTARETNARRRFE